MSGCDLEGHGATEVCLWEEALGPRGKEGLWRLLYRRRPGGCMWEALCKYLRLNDGGEEEEGQG